MTAVLCGMGDVFFSPAGGRAGALAVSVSGAAVFPVSADNGPFVCAERAFLLYGKTFLKGARAYDQKL